MEELNLATPGSTSLCQVPRRWMEGASLCLNAEKRRSDLKDKINCADTDVLMKNFEDVRQFMVADGADLEDLRTKMKELQ